MTLAELQADCFRRLGFSPTPGTETITRISAFLNESHAEILSEPGMESLLYDSITLASVASQPQYGLPPVVARIRTLVDTANRFPLDPMSLEEYREVYPDPSALTGIPSRWVDMGFSAFATPPSAAAEIFVKSTSASDVNTAYLEGFRTGGYPITLSVAMTGVTAKTLGAAYTDIIEITKFYLSAAAVGTVTLNQGSGAGTELSRLAIGQTDARYRRIALAITPASALTYTINFERDATDLINANDEPVLPPRFHRLLGVGARMREYEKQDQKRYVQAQAEYLHGIKKLKWFLYSQTVGTPNLRGRVPQMQRNSQLGSWYPAGS